MAAVGLELVDSVVADGHMMSMVFSREMTSKPAQLHERFNEWLALATGPALHRVAADERRLVAARLRARYHVGVPLAAKRGRWPASERL
jgi:hypothetical protein